MRTIPQLFETSCQSFPENALIREKANGEYQAISYMAIRKGVYALASELIKLGIKKGDRIALLAEGSSNWLIAELAVLYIGGISVPLSVKINESSDLLFRLQHSGSKAMFISSEELLKVRKIEKELTEIENIIVFNPKSKLNEKELDFDQLMESGIKSFADHETEINSCWQNLQEDDIANISYTSGTTADPKGIMLTHRNYTANVEQACSLFEVPEWYNTLLILSWDHSFAHTVGIYVLMKNGASISVVDPGNSPMERIRNIPKNIREVEPVFLLSVPAMARNFKKGIESGIKSKGKFTQRLFNNAIKTAYSYNGDGLSKKSLSRRMLKPLVWFYNQILFKKIRTNFGSRLQFTIGGGALLDIELQHFFYAIGIPMFQGYGLTEAAPIISSNTPNIHKLGTSGQIVENLDVKILDEDQKTCPTNTKGEIVVKGENVMKGYWKNELATHETLKNGWLHTGDMGYLDEDGFLYVLGRFKSLLIGNDGEKYSPEGIEEAIIDHSKYIDQCMLYNNQNPYTIGLFVLSKSALLEYLKSNSVDPKSEEAVNLSLEKISTEIGQYLARGKHEGMFPSRWIPSAIGILKEPFTEENGMINSTLKMVRSKVVEHNKEVIDLLYTTGGKLISNSQNIAVVKRLLNQ